MLSFWEREHMITYDIIIVGSGIVGLQTGLALMKKYPKARICILERGLLPTGASTRNAGFACFGSAAELLDDLKKTSEEAVYQLYAKRKNGIQLLRSQLGDEAMDYVPSGSLELLKQEETTVIDQLPQLNALLKDLHQEAIFRPNHNKIKADGINHSVYPYGVATTIEGSINTGKMMQALIHKAYQANIRIITGATVHKWEENQLNIEVYTEDASRATSIPFICKKLIFCTNAFSKTFFPDAEIEPGRGQILITHPIENLKINGIYHIDKGYYYFRNIGDRVLIGGGRNLAIAEEQTHSFGINETIEQALINKLTNEILCQQPFTIDMKWSGIMCFGATKNPLLVSKGNNNFGGFKLGGMGVALGTQLAHDLAATIHL